MNVMYVCKIYIYIFFFCQNISEYVSKQVSCSNVTYKYKMRSGLVIILYKVNFNHLLRLLKHGIHFTFCRILKSDP